MPSLGMLTVNALAAADNVVIPVQAAYLPARGLGTAVGKPSTRPEANQPQTENRRDSSDDGGQPNQLLRRHQQSDHRESYGGKLKVYKTDIPCSCPCRGNSAEGNQYLWKHDPKGKVAEAYKVLTKEVLKQCSGQQNDFRGWWGMTIFSPPDQFRACAGACRISLFERRISRG